MCDSLASSRMHSICQDLDAELQRAKKDLREAINAKFQVCFKLHTI